MASRNAFASNPHLLDGTEQDGGNSRPVKRARLSENVEAAIRTQSSHPDTSLEVDHMILDYNAYQTIRACLASRDPDQQRGSSQSLASNLAMSDAFSSIFKARHPTYEPDAELHFRMLLLKFTALFTQRLTSNPTTLDSSDLRELRADNQERARRWIGDASRMPSSHINSAPLMDSLAIPAQQIERNRAHVLHDLGIPPEDEDYEDAFYGTSASSSLLDIIPLFMRVSAARNSMNGSSLTERWMNLASEFMLQACLEQYLVYGAQGSDPIDEAFAWGYKDRHDNNIESKTEDGASTNKDDDLNVMFEDEEYEMEVEGWNSVKSSWLHCLSPSTQTEGIVADLEMVSRRHLIAEFERSMLVFLSALTESIPQPVLVQLESGRLDGMTEQQTRDFLADCGVGPARFFESPVGFKGSL